MTEALWAGCSLAKCSISLAWDVPIPSKKSCRLVISLKIGSLNFGGRLNRLYLALKWSMSVIGHGPCSLSLYQTLLTGLMKVKVASRIRSTTTMQALFLFLFTKVSWIVMLLMVDPGSFIRVSSTWSSPSCEITTTCPCIRRCTFIHQPCGPRGTLRAFPLLTMSFKSWRYPNSRTLLALLKRQLSTSSAMHYVSCTTHCLVQSDVPSVMWSHYSQVPLLFKKTRWVWGHAESRSLKFDVV